MFEPTKKPRVRFCWFCGRRLMGNHFTEIEFEGHKRIAHKQCAKVGDDYYDQLANDGMNR